jgi:outer membrane protein TolC
MRTARLCPLALLAGLATVPLPAQAPPPAAVPLAAPATPRPAPPAAGSLAGRPISPFQGSVPTGEASAAELPLSLADALERGLATNLGAVDSAIDARVAEAQRRRDLSALLPQVAGQVRHQTGEVSLIQFGFQLPGVPTIIGPFSYQDARVSLQQRLLDLEALRRYQSSRAAAHAADLTRADVRDTVVLLVGSAYFQVVADAARVDTAGAQLAVSQALDQLAAHQVQVGLVPAIDSLRATVQRQTDEQRQAVARAALDKDKLVLARLIGLPPGQRFALTSRVDYETWRGPGLDAALQLAYASRSDLKSAAAAVAAAELAARAARDERLPSVRLSADYGAVGKNLASTDTTFTVAADVAVPLWSGGRTAAAEAQAAAALDRRRADLADLKGRIDFEVRAAFLDLEAAQTSVEVARKNAELAERALTQARDRFENGVTNNVEVVLAEEAVAAAHENYIASLFAHNFGKLSLLRAMGMAEQGARQYLGGAHPGGEASHGK